MRVSHATLCTTTHTYDEMGTREKSAGIMPAGISFTRGGSMEFGGQSHGSGEITGTGLWRMQDVEPKYSWARPLILHRVVKFTVCASLRHFYLLRMASCTLHRTGVPHARSGVGAVGQLRACCCTWLPGTMSRDAANGHGSAIMTRGMGFLQVRSRACSMSSPYGTVTLPCTTPERIARQSTREISCGGPAACQLAQRAWPTFAPLQHNC